jgi:hypothetical protein
MTAIIRSPSIRLRKQSGRGGYPHTADGTPRVHAPSVFSTKPDPVRCPLSHHDARLNMLLRSFEGSR